MIGLDGYDFIFEVCQRIVNEIFLLGLDVKIFYFFCG